ncbi:uncharacterized protein LOC135952423 [Calliphora vicina]|uniref:uncharacterized protein LOC135952423 n=1 Tax=Calliphora vicina TaxID=7373 RepID=UPI00325BD00A
MLVTTYQHDYVPPFTKRYDFFKGQAVADQQEKVECQCIEENKVDIPKVMQNQCAVEWTGVAPMGRLIDPRIIPTQFSSEQLDALIGESKNDCFKEQPNRFLKILRTAYPDLYERLKQMPKDELNRRLERDRMYTTYQIDFCNINEYPEGIYESLKVEDETSKLNASKLLQRQEPCAELRANVMQELSKEGASDKPNSHDACEKIYKPFKISFADSSRFIKSGNNSHWRSNVFTKRAKFTEYMDTINKIGCVIMKNNIHDHQKCTGKHCRHQLIHACTNLK